MAKVVLVHEPSFDGSLTDCSRVDCFLLLEVISVNAVDFVLYFFVILCGLVSKVWFAPVEPRHILDRARMYLGHGLMPRRQLIHFCELLVSAARDLLRLAELKLAKSGVQIAIPTHELVTIRKKFRRWSFGVQRQKNARFFINALVKREALLLESLQVLCADLELKQSDQLDS